MGFHSPPDYKQPFRRFWWGHETLGRCLPAGRCRRGIPLSPCLPLPLSSSGQLYLRLWCNLHFYQSAQYSMYVIQVERIAQGELRKTKPLWLVWVGEQMPTLSSIWQRYLRRFAVDHWYRFIKQRLHWTLPHFSTPEQSERWSDLMPMLSWQLWLARDSIQDCPLPWQKSSIHLSPGRVANT